MKKISGAQAHLQWWLGLAVMLCIGWIAYTYMIKTTSLPQPELPRGACAGESKTYNSDGVNVVYRNEGCERVGTVIVVRAGEIYHQMSPALQAFRLPPLNRGLRLGVYAQGKPGYELLGRPGGPRAIVLRVPDRRSEPAIEPILRRAYAELALQEAAPGLDESDRRALSGALAYLTADHEQTSPGSFRLSASERRALEDLVAHGPFYLADRLGKECRPDCRWSRS